MNKKTPKCNNTDQFKNMGLGEKTQVAEECIQQDFILKLFRDLYLINHREQENKTWTRIILTTVQKNIIQEK